MKYSIYILVHILVLDNVKQTCQTKFQCIFDSSVKRTSRGTDVKCDKEISCLAIMIENNGQLGRIAG